MCRLAIVVAVTLCGTASLQAQVTVQQPAVRSARVGTTVTVPDRGRMFLGGVNSASSSRQSNGPLRTGTSREYGLTGGSMSVTPYIIDLQAMDEAILNSAPDATSPLTMRPRTIDAQQPVTVQSEKSAAERAANFERLAHQAEVAGKAGVAKLHWQMAARHGSTLAREKLQPGKAVAITSGLTSKGEPGGTAESGRNLTSPPTSVGTKTSGKAKTPAVATSNGPDEK